jgi:hypothetical protein
MLWRIGGMSVSAASQPRPVAATTLSGKGYTLSDRFCLKLVQHSKIACRIARCRCPCLGKIDLSSGDGVVEFQILGAQEISSIAGEAGEILKRLAG